MCDLEYVTHPLWAVYVIFKDLPALLFWNYVNLSSLGINHRDPTQKCHSEFSTDPVSWIPWGNLGIIFLSHHRWKTKLN